MDPPPRNPRPKTTPPRCPADLPLFIPRAAPAEKQREASPIRGPSRWRQPRTWIALAGLVLFLVGAWMLVPREDGTWADFFRDTDTALPTIVVDPGHGGHDNGAVRNGLREKDLALDTALRLERKLRAHGFPVVLTRRDDRFIDLHERAAIANRIPRAVFVSVHFNDNVKATGEGVETFYARAKVASAQQGWSLAGIFREKPEPPPADNGRALAEAVQTAICGTMPVVNRGSKPAGFAVLRHTRCAAVLVEGGFINNPAQAREVSRPAYRDQLATAIASAVSRHTKEKRTSPSPATLAHAESGR